MSWPCSCYWSCFWYVALVWIYTMETMAWTSQSCSKAVYCSGNLKNPCGWSCLIKLSNFCTWLTLRKTFIVRRLIICAYNCCWILSLTLIFVHETEMLWLISRKLIMAVISSYYYLLYDRPWMINLWSFSAWKSWWKIYIVPILMISSCTCWSGSIALLLVCMTDICYLISKRFFMAAAYAYR